MRQILAEVLYHKRLYQEVHLLWLGAPELTAAAPGQFFMVRCGEGYEPLLRRPLSLHRKHGEQVALLYRVKGKGLAWLSRRAEGETIDVLGPLGKGFALPQRPQRLLLVAGGLGIAPLVALAEEALAHGHQVTLLLGAVTASGLYPQELLPSGLELALATDDGSRGMKGPVSALAASYLPKTDALYACGPPGMYRSLAAIVAPGQPCQVSLEERMACGFGACFGCPVFTPQGPKLVCQDGPVFDLKALASS